MEHDLSANVTQVKVTPKAGKPVAGTTPDRNSTSRTLPAGADERGVGRIGARVRPDSEPPAAVTTSQLGVWSSKFSEKSTVLGSNAKNFLKQSLTRP